MPNMTIWHSTPLKIKVTFFGVSAHRVGEYLYSNVFKYTAVMNEWDSGSEEVGGVIAAQILILSHVLTGLRRPWKF